MNDYYTIPFRCLVPEKIENLLVAGRCISGTSGAAASYRVIPCCIATGQAAGTAAALCVKHGKTPRELEQDVSELQAALRAQGVILSLPDEE